ncbi:hypothetical protein [Vibrio sp. THAF190c]|uniref:hypothetical protein n=1 Tax=Vibrio sp. THAF190c TaxID=2587865 RepID=UPI001268579B|nr:hypothetical protein [Vibrio sp. THAF190c]QFT13448.1 hypothetical protein FIV04_26195 [Vibrio sp. THAF190c]
MEAIKASYHHVLATAVLNKLETLGGNTGDSFGEGEDSFLINLYEYTELVYELVYHFETKNPIAWKENMLWELMQFVANQFLFLAFRDSREGFTSMPDKKELRGMITGYLESLTR